MMLTLSDLSPAQTRLLARLDDGQPHEDSAGLELGGLSASKVIIGVKLWELGLIDIREGWLDSVWFRLTERGRTLRERGRVE